MDVNFDNEQREAIHIDRNAVIMAGAGSGKTTVLAERFYWLLSAKQVRVDEILTLTFTQKAAAEMYEKIYTRLKESGLPFVKQQLRDFDKAQISTLDSFCSQIVRNASETFGIAPDFINDEDRIFHLAEEVSLDFILNNLDNPTLQQLINIHTFEGLWKDFFTDLAAKHFHPAKELDFTQMYEKQIRKCKDEIIKHEETWTAARDELLALPPRVPSIQKNQEQLQSTGGIKDLVEQERYHDLLELLAGLKLKKPGGREAPDILLMKEIVDRLKIEAVKVEILAQTLSQQETLKDIFYLLGRFQALFNEKKRSAGRLTFQDIAEMSIQALVRNKALRQFYKNKFRYIMIDEFQDNNSLQKDLLYLLAERKESFKDGVPEACDLQCDKLFFVGDEKQSIYRFRGADVSVFKSLNNELMHGGGETIVLSKNYRSEPGLIHFFNRLFTVIMKNSVLDYEARFQELRPGNPENGFPVDKELRPEVHFFYKPFFESERIFSNEQSEAYHIARFLRDTVTNKRLLIREKGALRPAEFEDFTLLMRSTGNQIDYERMFRHLDIPYSTQNVRSLFLEAPINDFYTLLQLAVYPEDRPAYAGLLRSPFVNISDDAFIRLLLAGKDPFEGIDMKGIEEEDRVKLEKGRDLFQSVRQKIDRLSISELIHYLWYKTGYRYFVLQQPQNHNYLEYYDYFLGLAEKADQKGESLALFLDFLRENLGTYEKLEDLEILKSRVPGVQLMTIHKAKGLEFPIVILSDTGNRGRRSDNKTPYYVSDEFGVTVNLGPKNYFTLLGEEEIESKELAELKRLLYVALTRTKYHLIISGIHNLQNQNTLRAHINMLFKGLGVKPGSLPEKNDHDPYYLKAQFIEDLEEEDLYRHRSLKRKSDPGLLAPHYLKTAEIRRSFSRREFPVTELSRLMEMEGRQGLTPKTGEKGIKLPTIPVDKLLKEKGIENDFGILTHFLISQKLRGASLSMSEPDWLKFNIPEVIQKQCLESAVTLCNNFFSSQLGLLALKADHPETEFPFLYLWKGKSGPRYISGQIDLLFEIQGRAYIIDFKTDRMYRPGEYMAQLWLYSLAAQELVCRSNTISSYLFLLRSARPVPLKNGIDWKKILAEAPIFGK